ncbi:TolC family protein, partial [Bacteroidota bacterium]
VDEIRYKELKKLGEFQAKNIIESNVVEIARAFYNLVQQEQLLEVAQSTLKISKDRLDKSKVRNELGSASSTDLLNAQVSYNNDKATLLQRQLEVVVSKKNLNVLLGRNPNETVEVNQEIIIPHLNYDFDSLSKIALEYNSNLIIAKQNRIIADKDVDINQSFIYPRLSLNGSYGYNDRVTSTNSPRVEGDVLTQSTDGSVSLNLSFNIFNAFRDDVNLQSSIIQNELQGIALKKAETELLGNLKEKYETHLAQKDFIELEEQNVVAAEQNLKLQEERFQTGTTTSLEFRDAQVNLARAQNILIVARYQARITLLEIQQLLGELKVE